MDSCLPGHLYLKEDTRTIDVAAGRVSVMGQSVRNGALRFVAGATSIQHSFALRFAGSIPIDAPECTQSMRQRSELCAILRTSSFLARPRLLPASQFAALFAPHVYTDLGPVGPCSVTTVESPEVFARGLRRGSIPALRRDLAAPLFVNGILLPLSLCSRGLMWASESFFARVGAKVCIWTGP